MIETRVVNLNAEKCDVRIDRRTSLGNPFRIGEDGNRYAVIAAHERHWREMLHSPRRGQWAFDQLMRMKGKRLGCHCAPLPCHGDNYVKLIGEFCT
jgi:Domain of unknown function (DUF4326)